MKINKRPIKKRKIKFRVKNCEQNVKKIKDPLPMKLRAFPSSFWQQPNKTLAVSPGTIYNLPFPLTKELTTAINDNIRNELQRAVSKPNVDLLFSLFRNVDQGFKFTEGKPTKTRRGRPKKVKTILKDAKDDDPYLSSSFAETIVPSLLRKGKEGKMSDQEKVLGRLSRNEVALNSLPVESYAQLLSQLVIQL